MGKELSKEMIEYRKELNTLDETLNEVEYLSRFVDLKNPTLEVELNDQISELITTITEIQESEGWIK